MDRSINEFTKLREQQARERKAREREENRPRFTMGSARGTDAFFMNCVRYYQEADEADAADNEEEIDIDDAAAQLDKAMANEGSDDDNEEESDDEESDTTSPQANPPDMETETPSEPIDGHDEQQNLDTFGQHGGDDLPNNQYDPKEVAKVMEFVADEAKSLSDYMEAAKTSKVDILQRLYSDIADEERYHMEQLLFAKAEITGEEYKPKDPDIRKEYEELISLGMDESSAMATAVDKFNLHATSVEISKKDDAEMQQNMAEIKDAEQSLEQAMLYYDTIDLVMENAELTNNYTLANQIAQLSSPMFYQEDTTFSSDNSYSKRLSPWRLIITFTIEVNKLLNKLIKGLKRFLDMLAHRVYRGGKYLRDHGLSNTFAHGSYFYMWDDKHQTMDPDPLMYYVNCCVWAMQEVVSQANLRNKPYANELMTYQQALMTSGREPRYSRKPPFKQIMQVVETLDSIKTKVVITEKNVVKFRDQFFTSNNSDDYYKAIRDSEKGIPGPEGRNIYVYSNWFSKAYAILKTTAYFSDLCEKVQGEFEGLEGEMHSTASQNPKLYRKLADPVKQIMKGFAKVAKIFSNDLEQLYDLDKTINGQLGEAAPSDET